MSSFSKSVYRRRNRKVTDDLEVKASRGEENRHRVLNNHQLHKIVENNLDESDLDIEDLYR